MAPKGFPELLKEHEDELVESLLHWSLSNGLIMYPPNYAKYQANNAPITLFPTPFPKKLYENAIEVQEVFNELYVNVISKEKEWLIAKIKELSEFDQSFTGELFNIYQKILSENGGKLKQELSLGLFRSDYMINSVDETIKQIEFNTISVSFGGLSSKVGKLHQYLNNSGYYDDKYSMKYYDNEHIPISNSINKLAKGINEANYYYNDQTHNTKTVILFIIQEGERNVFDQRHIEYSLIENHQLKSYRLSLEKVQEEVVINNDKLYIKQTMDEVSVVYYRSGYGPNDYTSSKCWESRYLLEKTLAIKCPSILTQLSGTKKIQQILTNEEILKKLLPKIDTKTYNQLLSTFVKIYPLDDSEEGKYAKKIIFEDSSKFVLKPQREGGGNNIYKEDIPKFLQKIDEKDWGAYILMELIHPPKYSNKIIRNDEIYNEDIISELGIFGSIIFNETTGEIKLNFESGHLLRSKFSSSNEGGVAAGFGCVDNIYLYE